MSQYSRNERNANAGIVVGITPEDYAPMARPAGGHRLAAPLGKPGLCRGRRELMPRRRSAWAISWQDAPSTALGSVIPSYRPGVTPTDLSACLPDYAIAAIREALPAFGRQIKGFDMDDAVLTGRGDPHLIAVRIPRGEDFQSLNTQGLYPGGEGAGYAGGILSAGVDGIKVAEAVALAITGPARASQMFLM